MKHELVELVVYWLDIDIGVGLNLGRHKLSFLFAKIFFGMDVKGQKTLAIWEISCRGWEDI